MASRFSEILLKDSTPQTIDGKTRAVSNWRHKRCGNSTVGGLSSSTTAAPPPVCTGERQAGLAWEPTLTRTGLTAGGSDLELVYTV